MTPTHLARRAGARRLIADMPPLQYLAGSIAVAVGTMLGLWVLPIVFGMPTP